MNNIVSKFKEGFLKSAQAKGFSSEEAMAIYSHEVEKYADINNDYLDVNNIMREQGMGPEYSIDDSSPYATQYNQNILKLRDQAYEKDPTIEALKASAGAGARGGLLGLAGGHIAGHAAKHMLHPSVAARFHDIPRAGRGIGAIAGALAMGVPAALKAKQETEAAKHLADPNILQRQLDMLSKERQLSNNQMGNYRPIGITPQV